MKREDTVDSCDIPAKYAKPIPSHKVTADESKGRDIVQNNRTIESLKAPRS